ncbi:MAG: hypothetical protein EXR55_04860, partial [Dehalococcoidia bacterium]|nr:hypothetical protein [Dehalococcoidia bacterium]
MAYQITRESFTTLGEEWQQVLPQCATDSIFLTPLWQETWWRKMGSGELRLLRIGRDNHLLGIAPLASEGRRWRFLGDPSLFDYQDFIVPRGSEAPFFQALGEHLEGEEWDVLDLPSLLEGSPTLRLLPHLAQERGWGLVVEDEGVSPGIFLTGSWDEYLAGLTKKDRHELRRKLRRLEGATQYTTKVVEADQELPPAMDEFLTLMRTSRV